MTKARMRKAHDAFPLGHRLIGVAHDIADHGDGSIYCQIAAALFVATKDAEWNGGPTITALMRGVEDAAIEWGKCCGDYHAACQAAPPPSGLQATDAVREAGHRCELTYGYFQKAIKALADHGTQTGSLERLRERVQKALDANRSNPMIGTAVCAEEDCLRMVRDWIDEERGA